MTAKQNLVSDIENRIGEYLTAKQTKQVVEDVNAAADNYVISAVATGEVNTELLKIFLNAKEIEGRSRKTVNRYEYILERMLREVATPIEQIDTAQIREYLTEQKAHGLSDGSLEGVRSVLSSFFGWLWKEGLIKKNPCANIGVIKCQKKIRMPFSSVDIEKLKSECKTQRDKALVCFLLSTGARVSEVTELNRNDLDFQKLECTVLGKGNKERTVYIDEVTAMELQKYLQTRKDTTQALFVNHHGGRLDPQGVRFILAEIGKAAGVENVHPHRFRRTLATNLINHGMPIQEVALILGHDNINTTMTYVFMDKANVKNSYRKYM